MYLELRARVGYLLEDSGFQNKSCGGYCPTLAKMILAVYTPIVRSCTFKLPSLAVL